MASPLDSLVVIPNKEDRCSSDLRCVNSPCHNASPRCSECRLSPNNQWSSISYWKPLDSKDRHPVLEKEKRDEKRRKAIERQTKRQAKDPTKQARLRASARAERKTNSEIIKSTRNSGRINRDNDHVFDNSLSLDTKNQSNSENPIVHLHELDKARRDAKRAGYPVGGLVIRNKSGRGIVVFDEKDLPLIRRRNETNDTSVGP
jgi:hypothetical protein